LNGCWMLLSFSCLFLSFAFFLSFILFSVVFSFPFSSVFLLSCSMALLQVLFCLDLFYFFNFKLFFFFLSSYSAFFAFVTPELLDLFIFFVCPTWALYRFPGFCFPLFQFWNMSSVC
jgi:hypothetical protein